MERHRLSSSGRKNARGTVDDSLLFGAASSNNGVYSGMVGSPISPTQQSFPYDSGPRMGMSPFSGGMEDHRGYNINATPNHGAMSGRKYNAVDMSMDSAPRSRSVKKPPLTSILDESRAGLSANGLVHSSNGFSSRGIGGLQSPTGDYSSAAATSASATTAVAIVPSGTFQSPPASSVMSNASSSKRRSPHFSLESHAPVIDPVEASWSMWLIVYGFFPSSFNRDLVLQRFMQFGDVENHVVSGGNWMFIKYMTPVQALRAAGSQHGTYLNGDTLISVQVMDSRIAKYMNLQIARDGRLLVGGSSSDNSSNNSSNSGSAVEAAAGELRRRSRLGAEGQLLGSRFRVPEDDDNGSSSSSVQSVRGDDLYLKPYRRKNICERIVEYFFAY